MFRWLKRKPPLPPFSTANPGEGTWIRTAFANGQRSWLEEADTLDILAGVLESRGSRFERGKGRLDLDNGLVLRPQFVRLQPRDDGFVHTVSTVEVNHPELCPNGAFEYQHALDQTTADSLRKGLEGWADTDLPVFMDALRLEPQDCTSRIKYVPATSSVPARRREILFGPPFHAVTRKVRDSGEQHDFCPCCLLTNCLDTFNDKLEAAEFCGIRLFATRDQQGVAEADCRINGVDWAPGAEALRRYVGRWPDHGLEYRKQFVIIRTLTSP
jgi:hypothetical protein